MQKNFGQIVATIEPNDDRDGVNCWLQWGRHSSSLAVVSDFGAFDDGPKVPDTVLHAIEAWAQSHGY